MGNTSASLLETDLHLDLLIEFLSRLSFPLTASPPVSRLYREAPARWEYSRSCILGFEAPKQGRRFDARGNLFSFLPSERGAKLFAPGAGLLTKASSFGKAACIVQHAGWTTSG